MVLMLIFLILSIAFLIGTAIYVNYKKKNTNKLKPAKDNLGEKKIGKKSKKNMANVLQIKIKENIIFLGNRYSMVIRLGNIDYNMLSNKEQETIENILVQTALSIDYPIQFFSTTEFIDTSKIISIMKKNKTTNENIRKYKDFLTEYLQNLMENRSVSIVKNYAVISYDGLYENALEELNRRTASFKGNLLRANIVCDILTENELYNLIYRELNKNSALSIKNEKEGEQKLYVNKKQKEKRN